MHFKTTYLNGHQKSHMIALESSVSQGRRSAADRTEVLRVKDRRVSIFSGEDSAQRDKKSSKAMFLPAHPSFLYRCHTR